MNLYFYLQKCQRILLAGQYSGDFKALSRKLADSCDKKEKRPKERLKELNNDDTGETQWFPLSIDALIKTWIDKQLITLDNEYPTADLKEFIRRLDKTLSAAKMKVLIRELRHSPRISFWNNERLDKLKKLYPNHTNEEIAQVLGITYSAVNGTAFKLRLFKSKEFKFQCASKSLPPKGHQPMNKGRKQTGYMPEGQLTGTKTTQPKKGYTPENYKSAGYERTTCDGYTEVRTTELNVFELKHRLVRIEHDGEVPPDYNIQFKDGSRQDVSIENLYMISHSEQSKRENSLYARYPKDIRYLIKLKGALNR